MRNHPNCFAQVSDGMPPDIRSSTSTSQRPFRQNIMRLSVLYPMAIKS